MMFKKLSIVVLAAAAMLALSACGSSGSTSSKSGDEKQTVTYAIWSKDQGVTFQQLADQFHKKNPNITIKIQITPWDQYWTKLETAVTGGEAADVFWMNLPQFASYADQGILAPLDEVKFDKDKFATQFLDAYTYKGKLYGIPKDYDTNALIYNKTLFKQAGINPPDDTWTWDTWRSAAKKLTNKSKGIYGMVLAPTYQGGYYDVIYQNGGSPFTKDGKKSAFNTPAVQEALDFYEGFIKDGSGTKPSAVTGELGNALLTTGKGAMSITGSYAIAALFQDPYGKENLDIGPLPKGKTRATVSNSLANVIYAKSEHKAAARKWISFVSSKKASEMFAEAGFMIPLYEGTQDPWVKLFAGKNTQVYVDALKYAVPLPSFKNSAAAVAVEQPEITKAMQGEETMKQAAQNIYTQANAQLSK